MSASGFLALDLRLLGVDEHLARVVGNELGVLIIDCLVVSSIIICLHGGVLIRLMLRLICQILQSPLVILAPLAAP